MPKPIAVIFLPEHAFGPDGERISWRDCSKTTEKLDAEKPDYHWFVLLQPGLDSIKFQVFHEKDFTEIQYEELKKIIEDHVKASG